jgi:hypothetical protein
MWIQIEFGLRRSMWAQMEFISRRNFRTQKTLFANIKLFQSSFGHQCSYSSRIALYMLLFMPIASMESDSTPKVGKSSE